MAVVLVASVTTAVGGGKLTRIEILVPTYNRRERLISGLGRLSDQIAALSRPNMVAVSVSDNASDDGTWEALQSFVGEHPHLLFRCHRQPKNVGLEANAVALLQQASAAWVMYLGDDDLLPDGYLDRVLSLCANDETSCIVPGFTELFPDGSRVPARGKISEGEIPYLPSLRSCAVLGSFGHQLSGVCFRRVGTLKAYLARPEYRNLYPFIHFVGFNALRGRGWYLPRFQVLVLQEQDKDWAYDSSNLTRDVLANFRALFPRNSWKGSICGLLFLWSQPGRLAISPRDPIRTVRGFQEMVSSPIVSSQIKIALPLVYAATTTRLSIRKLRRVVSDRIARRA